MDLLSAQCSIAPMLPAFLMRSALWTIAAALGSSGVFCIIYSFILPYLAAHGLILLGAALAIVYFTDRPSTR
jgi:hypothetical protein